MSIAIFLVNSTVAQLFQVDLGFKAYFSDTPYLLKSDNTEYGTLIVYANEDEENLVVFTGSSLRLKLKLLPNERNEFLKNYLIGQIKSTSGKLLHSKYLKFKSEYALIYSVKSILSGYSVTKMSIAICKKSKLYIWSVQVIDDYSTANVKELFDKHLNLISIEEVQ